MNMAKKIIPKLFVEFASDSGSLFYLSVLEYRTQQFIGIVNNIDDNEVGMYVLDFAEPEKVDVRMLFSAITLWFYKSSASHPLSVEFSRLGLTPMADKIFRTFELAHVTRLVGNGFQYDVSAKPKVRRRRVLSTASSTEIRLKKASKFNAPPNIDLSPKAPNGIPE